MKAIKSMISITLIATLWSCDNGGKTKTTANVSTTDTKTSGLKVAYVNIDSMQYGLEYFNTKKKEFEGKEKAIADEMSRYQREIQNAYATFQNKIKSKNISEVEAEQTQRRLEQMQVNAAKKQESLTANFMQQQAKFNDEFVGIIETFLEEYNKEHNYDFIFTQGPVKSVLYHKPQYDITKDVTDKMNEWIKNKKNESFINDKLKDVETKDTTTSK